MHIGGGPGAGGDAPFDLDEATFRSVKTAIAAREDRLRAEIIPEGGSCYPGGMPRPDPALDPFVIANSYAAEKEKRICAEIASADRWARIRRRIYDPRRRMAEGELG